jgi:hypothetical protein
MVIILVGLSQGVSGISDLALNYLYKDDLKLQPSQVSKITSMLCIPWIVKPIYGFLSDCYPIIGYRRKSYLFIFGLTAICCWLLMSLWATTIYQIVTIVMITQISNAFCSVIAGYYNIK